MALVKIKATLGQSLGDGKYNSTAGAGYPPASLDTAVTAAIAACAAVTANATVAGDPTALALAQAADTAAAAVATARTSQNSGDLVLIYDAAVITNKNALRSAIKAALLLVGE